MKDRTEKLHDLICPHFVWGAIRESSEWQYSDYFRTPEEAQKAFDWQRQRGLWKCLVLGEIAIFERENGKTEKDYVHFRWSGFSEADAACPHPTRGYGLADSAFEAVRYKPRSDNS